MDGDLSIGTGKFNGLNWTGIHFFVFTAAAKLIRPSWEERHGGVGSSAGGGLQA
jgi:hypothetical protein